MWIIIFLRKKISVMLIFFIFGSFLFSDHEIFSDNEMFLSFINFFHLCQHVFANQMIAKYGWTFDGEVVDGAATEAPYKVDYEQSGSHLSWRNYWHGEGHWKRRYTFSL